jgi:hypothetical protein
MGIGRFTLPGALPTAKPAKLAIALILFPNFFRFQTTMEQLNTSVKTLAAV